MKNATMSEVRTALLKGGVMVRDATGFCVMMPDRSYINVRKSTAQKLFAKGDLQWISSDDTGYAHYWTLWPHVAERMGKE